MTKITSIEFSNYYGKITVYAVTDSGEKLLFPEDEAKQILVNALNAGYDTTLEPRQQYRRIHISQTTCEQTGCTKPAHKPYCWCLEHHNQRANS